MKGVHLIILGFSVSIFQCKENSHIENKSNKIPAINLNTIQKDVSGDTVYYDIFEKCIQTNDTLYKASNIEVTFQDAAFNVSIGSARYIKIHLDATDYEGPGYSLSLFSSSKSGSSKLLIIEAQADLGTAWYYAVFMEGNKIVSEYRIKEPRSNSEIYSIDTFIKACKIKDTYMLQFKDDLIASYSKVPDNLLHMNGYYILEIRNSKNDTLMNRNTSINKNRRLIHVFYSNGGILAFYSDGTVTGCPQCDLDKDNIELLKSQQSFATYTSTKTSVIVQYTNGSKSEMSFYVDAKVNEEWAMKDGKWL
jgi:hypothetical protein